MKPYSQIRVGDVYRNPMTGGEWVVHEKNDDEKTVAILLLSDLPPTLNRPIWKSNRDRVFGFPQVQVGN